MMIRSLRARLFLLATLALAPAIGLILYTAVVQQKVATESTRKQAQNLAHLISDKHKDLIHKTRSLLATLADHPALRTPGPQCTHLLQELIKSYPYYANIGILNARGHAFCSAVPISGPVDLSFRTYYQRAVQTGEFSVGDYQVGKITGKSSVNFSLPIYNKNHTLVSVLYAALDLGWLNKIFMGKNISDNFIFLITDQNGIVLVKHPEDGTWVGKSIAESPLFKAIQQEQKGTAQYNEFDQTPRVFAFSPLDKESSTDNHLYFALGLANDSVIAAANPILGKKISIIIFILLATLSIIWLSSHILVLKSLRSILKAIQKIKGGDFNARTGIRNASDEIGHLASEFDEMASSLQAQIQKRELAEQDLRKALMTADAASKAKSDFVAHMSHEIRTPIGAIIGFSELLQESEIQETQKLQYLQIVRQNASHLLQLVDGILDVSRVEAGIWETHRVSFSLATELVFLNDTFTAQAESKKLEFKMHIEGRIPEIIHSDPLRLRQILANLLTNAIKFTDSGAVEMKVRFLEKSSLNLRNQIEFLVCDTGCGMTSEQLKKIFNPFVQGDSSMARRHGGAGLGLYLSKRFAEALNGEITVLSSTPGQGSIFRATVDAGPIENAHWILASDVFQNTSPKKPVKDNLLPLKGFSILVVEDTVDTQILLNRLLTSRGAKVVLAENAEIGITQAFKGHFDLIIMDIQLPGMNGLEATRHLRSSGLKIPILALTAHAMKGERESCLAAGCDAYSTKPVSMDEIVNIILSFNIVNSRANPDLI